MRQILLVSSVALSWLLLRTGPLSAHQWRQFGGQRRDFTLSGFDVHPDLLAWPAGGPRQLWQRSLGDGFSGISISAGRLVTVFRQDDVETVVAFDASSGDTLWKHSYDCPFESWEYGSGAFSTPTIVDDRVYCVGVMAVLHCLDLETGAVLWKHHLLEEYGGRNPGHGYACSPIAVDNLIILTVGGPADDYTMEPISPRSCDSVFAFDQQTGDVVWSTPLNHRIRHASPILINVDKQPQLVVPLYEHIAGLDPASGKQLWQVNIEGHTNVSVTPVWHAELQLLVTANSYGPAKGLHGIRLERDRRRTVATRVWDNPKVENWHASMVLDGNELIVSAGGGPAFLSAVHLADGKVLAKQRGFGKTNIVKLGDRYLLLDERGQRHWPSGARRVSTFWDRLRCFHATKDAVGQRPRSSATRSTSATKNRSKRWGFDSLGIESDVANPAASKIVLLRHSSRFQSRLRRAVLLKAFDERSCTTRTRLAPARWRRCPPGFRDGRGRLAGRTAWRGWPTFRTRHGGLWSTCRICQWDILEFSTNPQHKSPDFPRGYWPDSDAPPDDLAWEISLSQFRDDLDTMRQLVCDPSTDLFAKLPHGDGQTILREALLLADHNAYHIGQLVILRRACRRGRKTSRCPTNVWRSWRRESRAKQAKSRHTQNRSALAFWLHFVVRRFYCQPAPLPKSPPKDYLTTVHGDFL